MVLAPSVDADPSARVCIYLPLRYGILIPILAAASPGCARTLGLYMWFLKPELADTMADG